jgi:hypothetical protein
MLRRGGRSHRAAGIESEWTGPEGSAYNLIGKELDTVFLLCKESCYEM